MEKYKYPGELGKLRRTRYPGLLASESAVAAHAAAEARERLRLLDLLRDHFGISESPTQWLDLSLALAAAHVPAFDTRKKARASRPTKWTPNARAVLYVESLRLKREDRSLRTDKAIAARLAKAPRWLRFVGAMERSRLTTPDPAEVLRTQLSGFKKENPRTAGVTLRAFYWHQETDDLAGWDAFVDSILADPGDPEGQLRG